MLHNGYFPTFSAMTYFLDLAVKEVTTKKLKILEKVSNKILKFKAKSLTFLWYSAQRSERSLYAKTSTQNGKFSNFELIFGKKFKKFAKKKKKNRNKSNQWPVH